MNVWNRSGGVNFTLLELATFIPNTSISFAKISEDRNV